MEDGFFPSRERARAAILAGLVEVDGRVETRAGRRVPQGASLAVRGPDHPYVGRGGVKLAGALDTLGLNPRGLVCLDVGASTGGFTDCLLQRGAARVYAVDVGRGQLAWRLRRDPRVVVREGINARRLGREHVPEPVDLAVVDVSFISLTKILPAVVPLLTPAGRLLALVKPQFEAGREKVGRGGVVRDPAVHREVLLLVLAAAEPLGLRLLGLTPSVLRGDRGNVEFFVLWERGAEPAGGAGGGARDRAGADAAADGGARRLVEEAVALAHREAGETG